MIGWVGIAILIVAAISLILAGNPGATFGVTDADFAQLASATALLIVIGLPLLWSYRGRLGEAGRHAAIWLGIALVLLLAYTYRFEVLGISERVLGEVVPGMPVSRTAADATGAEQRIVTIRSDASGHFSVRAMINGRPLPMMVDTGATSVTLSFDDARRVGINTDDLQFTAPVSTANGIAYAAPVRLQSLSVGAIEATGLSALVTQPDTMRGSLLGMNFLRSLGGFEIRGNELILRQ